MDEDFYFNATLNENEIEEISFVNETIENETVDVISLSSASDSEVVFIDEVENEVIPLRRTNFSINQDVESTSDNTNNNLTDDNNTAIFNNVDNNNINNTSINSNSEDDNCIICTEPYYSTGDHQLSCLKCGHIFGKNCIIQWLHQNTGRNRCCPQCKKPAKKTDVIKIFARSLKPIDNDEKLNMERKILYLEKKLKAAEIEKNKIQINCEMLVKENNELKLRLMNNFNKVVDYNKPIPSNFKQEKPISNFQVAHLKDIKIDAANSRYLCYMSLTDSLLSSIENTNRSNVFNENYGIQKTSIENEAKEFIYIHKRQLKGMVANQYDGSLLTISLDNTLKITSMITKSIFCSVDLPDCPHSIEISPTNNSIYVGIRNGKILTYDKRHMVQPVVTISSASNGSFKSPVVSMSRIEYKDLGTKHEALLAIELDSCWVNKFNEGVISENFTSWNLPFEGRSMSCDFDEKSGYSLISFRPSTVHPTITHYASLFQIIWVFKLFNCFFLT